MFCLPPKDRMKSDMGLCVMGELRDFLLTWDWQIRLDLHSYGKKSSESIPKAFQVFMRTVCVQHSIQGAVILIYTQNGPIHKPILYHTGFIFGIKPSTGKTFYDLVPDELKRMKSYWSAPHELRKVSWYDPSVPIGDFVYKDFKRLPQRESDCWDIAVYNQRLLKKFSNRDGIKSTWNNLAPNYDEPIEGL